MSKYLAGAVFFLGSAILNGAWHLSAAVSERETNDPFLPLMALIFMLLGSSCLLQAEREETQK